MRRDGVQNPGGKNCITKCNKSGKKRAKKLYRIREPFLAGWLDTAYKYFAAGNLLAGGFDLQNRFLLHVERD
ncbi:hypothetical protein [Microbulbifer sp. MCCC 1A16149]|uniref:hypothetical protein n=1 Tax=Microbulbifer sp. MCCC 1A16149 TaxID=3411322 RepID=UPI003D0E5214